MTVLDKIKAFFKQYKKMYLKGMELVEPKPEAKVAEKKAAEPPKAKVVEAPGKKVDESSSK